jgi:hypothetical protein
MITKCTCEHEYQDRRYGKQNRVHNQGSKGAACTVCGIVKLGKKEKKEEVEA